MVGAAKVVSAGVDNDGTLHHRSAFILSSPRSARVTYTKDGGGTNELDEVVLEAALSNTVGVGLNVAHITNVAGLVGAVTVSDAEGVEVRAGGGAAVGVVAELVDVEATLRVGVVALDLVLDHGGGVLVLLGELDDTGDTGVAAEGSNCEEESMSAS